jgi:hypothetical protein
MTASYTVKPVLKAYTLKLLGSLSTFTSKFVSFNVVLSDPCTSSVISSTAFNAV